MVRKVEGSAWTKVVLGEDGSPEWCIFVSELELRRGSCERV